jgi:hypothetical protein
MADTHEDERFALNPPTFPAQGRTYEKRNNQKPFLTKFKKKQQKKKAAELPLFHKGIGDGREWG